MPVDAWVFRLPVSAMLKSFKRMSVIRVQSEESLKISSSIDPSAATNTGRLFTRATVPLKNTPTDSPVAQTLSAKTPPDTISPSTAA